MKANTFGKSRGAKHEPLHWTIEYASSETGMDRRTLSKNLKQLGIEPAFSDGKFSTAQIMQAVHGSKYAVDLRIKQSEAEDLELTIAERRGKLIDKAELLAIVEPAMVLLIQRVENLPIADALKDDIRSTVADALKGLK